jgi:hypothetical protein
MPESDDTQRFDRLLDAMVKKPPLDLTDKEPPSEADDKREPEAD